jgi:membrane protein required for colicin V production
VTPRAPARVKTFDAARLPMNGFDFALIAVIALSTLFAFVRGVVRELIAIATWIVGFVVAIEYAGPLAGLFPRLDVTPAAKHVLAFALILFVVMIAGALVAWMLSNVVRAIGLGIVDRLLGAVFGVARGLLVVVAFALIAGVTTLPKHDWWQNATLGPTLSEVALSLKPYLPRAWAERLDFSGAGRASAGLDGRATGAPPGECLPCVES